MGKKSTFDLKSILNKVSLQETVKEENEVVTPEYEIHMINVYDLMDNIGNFYIVEDIKDLKDSIEIFGVQQPLIVTKQNSFYKIIAGHRRKKACMCLVEEGKREYVNVPCIIRKEQDYLYEKLLLIYTNSTARELTDYEKMEQVKQIKEILMQLRQKESITGRTRDIISGILKISSGQVARMESIDNNLSQEFKEEFKEGNINVSTAYEISGLVEEKQKEMLQEYKNNNSNSITIKDVKEKKKEETRELEVQSNMIAEGLANEKEVEEDTNELEVQNDTIAEGLADEKEIPEDIKEIPDNKTLTVEDINLLSRLSTIYNLSDCEKETINKCVDVLWKYTI